MAKFTHHKVKVLAFVAEEHRNCVEQHGDGLPVNGSRSADSSTSAIGSGGADGAEPECEPVPVPSWEREYGRRNDFSKIVV